MNRKIKKVQCEPESLRAQLSELNIRSRAYTAQLWQIPFAYIGISVVVLDQVIATPEYFATALLLSGILGTAVLFHITAMLEGTKRAVANIRKVEGLLRLEPTAEYRPFWHIGPFITVTALFVASSYIAAVYFWPK